MKNSTFVRRLVFPGLIFFGVIALPGLRSLSASAAGNSAAGCLAPDSTGIEIDSTAIDIRDELVDLMDRTDKLADTILAAKGVARVAVSQIAIVQDTTICRRAADAYGFALDLPIESRLVHVIRAGIRYVVTDPTVKSGQYEIGVTFDSSFTHVFSKFAY